MTSLTMNRRRGGSFLLLLNLSMLAKKPSNLGALLVVASSFLPALVSSSHRACRSFSGFQVMGPMAHTCSLYKCRV